VILALDFENTNYTAFRTVLHADFTYDAQIRLIHLYLSLTRTTGGLPLYEEEDIWTFGGTCP